MRSLTIALNNCNALVTRVDYSVITHVLVNGRGGVGGGGVDVSMNNTYKNDIP